MNTIVTEALDALGHDPTPGPLTAAAVYFAGVYNARSDVIAEQRDWSRTIAILASDTGESVTLRVIDGRLCNQGTDPAEVDVTITSDSATLCDVLELRRSPNEPYLFGELTVRGPEADFLRIDYIAAVLCPA